MEQNGEPAETQTQPETEVSEELSIYGTWKIEKVALISEMYTGTTLDGDKEEDLYDSEDFLGYELEYTETFFRIGDKVYENPKYITSEDTVKGFDLGNSFRPMCLYTLIVEENIEMEKTENSENLEDAIIVEYDLEFENEVSYGKYDFIPVGAQVILLNDDAMLVGVWGKILLAYRIE
ncbi:MAG: hypothetical protein ACI39N_07470 [Lachnospiraceae bacterium]